MAKVLVRGWIALAIFSAVSLQGTPAGATLSSGSLAWPLRGAILRAFEEPISQYSSGHRGIDIAAPLGSPVGASAPGTVTFAGSVAGSLYVTVDHGDGVKTTSSWLSAISVKKGDLVVTGQILGSSGAGHPGSAEPHLHFAVRIDGIYVDPLLYLERIDVVDLLHLAPLPVIPAA